jgi:hypothetical protein
MKRGVRGRGREGMGADLCLRIYILWCIDNPMLQLT